MHHTTHHCSSSGLASGRQRKFIDWIRYTALAINSADYSNRQFEGYRSLRVIDNRPEVILASQSFGLIGVLKVPLVRGATLTVRCQK